MCDIRLGGLTPPVSLVRAIAAEIGLPLRVMVRENAGYGTDAAELVRMCRAAAAFAALEIDGLVIGFARDGRLLLNELREVLHAASTLSATFHRAFDSLTDPFRAIDVLAETPQIDRILTDGLTAGHNRLHPDSALRAAGRSRRSASREGGQGYGESAEALAKAEGPPRDRCLRLQEYSDRAGSRVTIIAGSGVDEEMLGEIARSRCVREVHVGRAARDGADREGPVTAARVRRLREIANGLPELP